MTAAILLLAFADPGSDALQIFQAKCAKCHGPDVKEPPLGFGYILDLKRLAADKDRLEAVGAMVSAGNMPPRSEKKPLTAAEKATVGDWIAAGAPPPKAETTGTEIPDPSTQVPAPGTEASTGLPLAEDTESAFSRTVAWVGKFHLLVLHFPIATIFLAAMCEAWFWWKGEVDRWGVTRFCLVLAALFSLGAVSLGWLYALSGVGASQPGILFLHRWVGTLAAVMLVATALLSEMDWRWFQRSWPTRLMIFLSALTVGATGHFGGMLVHGPTFLDW